jgi:hypothetical protein
MAKAKKTTKLHKAKQLEAQAVEERGDSQHLYDFEIQRLNAGRNTVMPIEIANRFRK